jgi:hypothetical protein
MNALLLVLALTGQHQPSDYNLLAQENVPAAKATVQTPNGAYADEKVGALADARAKVRAYSRGLAEAQAQVNALTQSIAQEPPPRARIQYEDETGAMRETAPVIYREVPVIRTVPIRRYSTAVPNTQSAPVTYTTAAPATADNGCYSSAYQSTSVYSAPPVTYAAAPPVTYAAATVMAAVPTSFGSNVTTYQERTRVGLFGRARTRARSTSVSSGVPTAFASPTTFGAMPMTFGASFGAGAVVCATCP